MQEPAADASPIRFTRAAQALHLNIDKTEKAPVVKAKERNSFSKLKPQSTVVGIRKKNTSMFKAVKMDN